MAISATDNQRLDEFYAEYKNLYHGCREDYFALFYLKSKFGVQPQEVAQQVSFGNCDLGIDAYYIDRAARNLYLYQFKWTADHTQFKEAMDTLLHKGIPQMFDLSATPDTKKADHHNLLTADLVECRNLIERVYIYFVFKGDVEAAENSSGLSNRKEDLEAKEPMIRLFFKRDEVNLRVEFISDTRMVPPPPPPGKHTIDFGNPVEFSSSDDKRLLVGFARLTDLHAIYKLLGQKFLSRNIRAALSEDNPPNRKIKEALRNVVLLQTTPPEHFTFFHNGVTLAAEVATKVGDRVELVNPRLLNGAQTICTFDRFVAENPSHHHIKSDRKVIESLHVLTRIVVEDPASAFVTLVTIANNQQNPVEPWNLRANDRIQCDLEDKLSDEVHIFYSRQEKAFANLSREEREERGIVDDKDIQIRPLAQAFLALQGRLDKITQMRDVFGNQKLYEETFKRAYLSADVRSIVLIHKIGMVLNSPMDKLREKVPMKWDRGIKRAKYLVWALLIQAVLNDQTRLAERQERFGTDLTKQNDLRQLLEGLAGGKVWNCIHSACQAERYKNAIRDDKFDFLRTQDMYKACIKEATDRYSWKKLSI